VLGVFHAVEGAVGDYDGGVVQKPVEDADGGGLLDSGVVELGEAQFIQGRPGAEDSTILPTVLSARPR
jgi:hypothetical protein